MELFDAIKARKVTREFADKEVDFSYSNYKFKECCKSGTAANGNDAY